MLYSEFTLYFINLDPPTSLAEGAVFEYATPEGAPREHGLVLEWFTPQRHLVSIFTSSLEVHAFATRGTAKPVMS